MIKPVRTTLCLATVLCCGALHAEDWNQYRGSRGDGISTEAVDLKWADSGPKEVWKVPTKNGFSSFAVSGGKAFIQVNRDMEGAPMEILAALDANTGKELWTAPINTGKYDNGGDAGTPDNKGGDGPRSTPAVSGGKVYVLSQLLVLHCFDANTGKSIWSKDLVKEFGGKNISWKSAASPVVDGNLVFAAAGGPGQSLLAFNKDSGEVAWKGFDEKITHATPVAATIHGVRQVIFFCQSGLVSVNAQDGKLLWRFPFRFSVSTASSPVVSGDIVYCSAGYGVGGGACRVSKEGEEFKATELWKIAGDKKVANHWSTPVVKDGYLYGLFSFKQYGSGPFKCVDLATGEVKWEQPGFGAGQAILVNGRVLALTDGGEIVAIDPSPAGYKEVARHKAVKGKCWSTPAFSNGRLYVRSTQEGVCLDIGKTMAGQ